MLLSGLHSVQRMGFMTSVHVCFMQISSLLFGNLFMLYVPEHALSVWFENVIFALLFSYKEAPLTVHCAFSIGCF